MKIFFDSSVFCFQKYGGISRYIMELATHISKTNSAEVCVYGGLSKNEYLNHWPDHDNLKKYFLKRPDLRINSFATSASEYMGFYAAKFFFKNDSCSVYHPTFYNCIAKYQKLAKVTVGTIYDMIPEVLNVGTSKDLLKRKEYFHYCDGLASISASTLKDFNQIFPDYKHKSKTILINASLPQNASPGKKVDRTSPYILFVGSRNGYKNGIGALKVIAKAKAYWPELKLILAGPPLNDQEKEMCKKFNIHNQVECAETTEDQLDSLYRNAHALIYCSLYEGFGMPILEAMSRGCPVITSPFNSMGEIAKEAAILSDPNDAEQIAKGVMDLRDSSIRKKYVDLGFKRSNDFAWEKTAFEMLDFYRMILNGK